MHLQDGKPAILQCLQGARMLPWLRLVSARIRKLLPARYRSSKAKSKPSSLLSLPAEIQNEIFEHLYPQNPSPIEIDLADVAMYKPPPAPLLACRQVYKDMLPLYETADRLFWQTHRFTFEERFGSDGNQSTKWALMSSVEASLRRLKLSYAWHGTVVEGEHGNTTRSVLHIKGLPSS